MPSGHRARVESVARSAPKESCYQVREYGSCGCASVCGYAVIRRARRLAGLMPPVVLVFAAGILTVSVLATLSVLLDVNWHVLKVGEEANVPTWFSTTQLFAVGAILLVVVWPDIKRDRTASWALILVPGLFLYLSLDEAATLHEQLGRWFFADSEFGSELRTGPWMFFVAPIVAVVTSVAAWVFWPYLRGRRDVIARFVAGVALFGAAAVGLELIGNFTTEGSQIQKVIGFGEEVGEMIAVNVILWAAVLVAQHEGVRLHRIQPASE